MRADKHLDKCTEECQYNMDGKCAFGIRHIGCYLDDDIRVMAGQMLIKAKEVNSIQCIKDVIVATIKEEKV